MSKGHMPKKKTTRKKTSKKTTAKVTKKSNAKSSSNKSKSVSSSKKTSQQPAVSPEMSLTQLILMYVVFLVVNSVVVLVANTLYPNAVVLGTNLISPLQALLQSMAVFSLVTVAGVPIIETVADQMKLKLGFGHWMVLYAAINAGSLWIVARFAEVLGLGIISWQVVVALAIVMDLVQGAAIKLTQDESA